MTAGAAGRRALQLTRTSYGVALVLAPGATIRLATGRLPGRQARRVARLLGARHLIQAALTAVVPQPAVFMMGAQIDTIHSASMLALAAFCRSGCRAALTDALVEAAFGAVGALSFGRGTERWSRATATGANRRS
jgi:hypothetical protein